MPLEEYEAFKDTDFYGGRQWGGWFDRKGEAVVFGETVEGMVVVNMVDLSSGVEGYLRAGEGKLGVMINRLVTVVYDEYLGQLRQVGLNLGRYLTSSAKEGLPLSEECLEFLGELKKRDESILVSIDLSQRNTAFFRLTGNDVPSVISRVGWNDDISEVEVKVDTIFPGVVLRLTKEDGALVFKLVANGMVSDCRLSEFVDAAILRDGRHPGVNKCRELLRAVCLTARI